MQPTSPSQEPNLAELSAKFDDPEAWGYGEGLEAPVTVYGINFGLPLLVSGVLFVGWWRRKRRADRAARVEAQAEEPADDDGEVVVRGKVCDVEGSGPAIKITVEQIGVERQGKGNHKTTWTEISRRTEARPFTVELSNGSRLRVEPGDEPRLVDDLGLWERSEPSKKGPAVRTASATLDLGEEVYAIGELGTGLDPSVGYRGGDVRVLRPPQGGPMHLSTHGLAAPFREQARRFAKWIGVLAGVTALVQLAAVQYHLALLFGEAQTATVESRWAVLPDGHDANLLVSYRVTRSSTAFTERIEQEDWDRLAPGTIVPVHVSAHQTTLGPHPNINGIIPILSTLALLVAGAIALSACYRKREWYERRMVETQSGRLDE